MRSTTVPQPLPGSRLFYLENFETVLNVEEVALGDEEELLDLPVVQGRVGPARRPVAHRHQSRLEPAQDLKPVDVFLNSHLWRLHQVCLLEAYYHFCFKWSGAVSASECHHSQQA